MPLGVGYCKCIIGLFSMYNIWWSFNFLLLSVDLIWWLIEIQLLSIYKCTFSHVLALAERFNRQRR